MISFVKGKTEVFLPLSSKRVVVFLSLASPGVCASRQGSCDEAEPDIHLRSQAFPLGGRENAVTED
jgi:hypothetical protein